MTTDTILILITLIICTVVLSLIILLNRRKNENITDELDAEFELLRKKTDENAALSRRELTQQFSILGEMHSKTSAAAAQETRKNIELLRSEMEQNRRDSELRQRLLQDRMEKQNLENAANLRQEVVSQFAGLNEISLKTMSEISQRNDRSMGELKGTIEQNLLQMRETVEKRLSESISTGLEGSFKSVSSQLEQVYLGLGQMQNLTSDILDLKKVLGNVKNRGSWGEMQLGNLLSDMLAPGQFEREKMLGKGRSRVDFAIRLPGEDSSNVFLPVDSKFPLDKYNAVLIASETGENYKEAMTELKNATQESAKSIGSKYILPPETTDFAVMFVPSEGLFSLLAAEGMLDLLRQKYHVLLAGPSTFSALLSAIQTGFRSLAIRKNSEEIFRLLGEFKKTFGNFEKELEQAIRSLNAAQNNLEKLNRSSGKLSTELTRIEELGENTETKEV